MNRTRVFLLYPLAILAALLLFVLAGGFLLLRSDAGRSWVKATVESTASDPEGIGLAIGSLEGALPGELILKDVRLTDPEGVWLSADRARLAWNPAGLLAGRLVIDTIDLGSLTVARPPSLPAAAETVTEPEPFSLEIPLEVALRHLSVERLDLGAGLIGEPASLTLEGQAAADRAKGFAASLKVQRIDGAAGRIDLTASLSPDAETLVVDLEAGEPAGGVLARLIGQPDLPPVSLTLKGSAPLRDWRGRLEGQVEGQGELGADLRLAAVEKGYRFGAEGRTAVTLPEGEPFAPLLAEGLTFDLAGLYGADGLLTLDLVKLDSPALVLDAAGSLDTNGLIADLKVQAVVKDPDLLAGQVAGLSLPGARIQAHLQGPLDRPQADIQVTAAELALPGLRASGLEAALTTAPEGALGGAGSVLPFDLTASLGGLAVEGQDQLAPLLDSGARLQAAGRLALDDLALTLDSLTLESDAATLDAQGEIALEGPSGQLALEAALPDLARLAPLAGGLPITGSLALKGDVTLADRAEEILAKLAVTSEGLDLGDPASRALLGSAPSLQGDLALSFTEGVTIKSLTLEGEDLQAEVTGRTDAAFETLEAEITARLPALAPLGAALETELAGALTLEGKVSGALADPQATLILAGRDLAAAGQPLGALDLTLTAEQLVTAPAGRVEARLDAPQADLKLATDFQLAGEQLKLSGLTAGTSGLDLKGDLGIDLATSLAEGSLEARAADLAPLLALAGQEGEGRAAFDLELKAEGGKQAASLGASLADLGYLPPSEEKRSEEEIAAARVSLRKVEIQLRSSDVQALQAEGQASLQDLNAGRLFLESADLTAEGGSDDLGLTLAARGRLDKPLSLDATARVRREGKAIAVTLTRLEGGALGLPYALKGQTEIELEGERIALGGLDLELAGGRLSGSGGRDGAVLEADVTLDSLALHPFGELAGLPDLAGELEARLTLEGQAPAPTARLEVKLDELTTAAAKEVPPIDAEARADWQAGRLALNASVGGFATERATLEAELPLTLDPASLEPVLSPASPLEGRMDWAGPIEQLWALMPLANQTLAGQASVEAEVGGTLGDPQASGSITLAQGRYENIPNGTLLDDLEMQVTLQGREAVVERLSATDGGKGRLELSGKAQLDPLENFPFDLQAKLQDMTLVRRDEVTGAIDGDLKLSGTTEASTVEGNFVTRGMEIRIPNQLPPDVVDLEVKEVNLAAVGRDPLPEPEATQAPPSDISLAVGIELPGQVFVRGRGLDSEWKGDIQVGGRADAPTLNGELQLVRGQLTLLSRTFTLNRGRISFGGIPGEIDPLLDIVATSETDDLTVTVTLSGSASRPQIALSSQPTLPQDEILSRVLFGKTTTELSAFEAVQLASAAAELSGKGSSVGVLDFARNLIGVDVLRVEGGEGDSSAPSVEAGKYVTEDVFVGVKQGAAAGSGRVAVEVELTPNILLESGVGQSGNSEVGVKFKWDY